ncbi:MAG: hypothetical protein Q9183_004974 [Haloplaca sp. 2 TL-2023]
MTSSKAKIFEPVAGDAFARLIPRNPSAKKAFSEVVNHIRADASSKTIPPAEYIRAEPDTEKLTVGCGFTESEVDDHNQRVEKKEAWTGAYIVSLKPRPRAGLSWSLGSQNGQGWTSDIDLVLQINENQEANSKHAIFNFASILEESRRFKIIALHSISVSGLSGNGPPLQYCAGRALEDGDVITIGALVYSFEFTDFGKSDQFASDSKKILDDIESPATADHLNNRFSAYPPGVELGNFKCTNGAYLRGLNDEIFKGSNTRGDVVAIKRYRYIGKEKLTKHFTLMEALGPHRNLMHILDSFTNRKSRPHLVFCMYSPVASASLTDLLANYQSNIQGTMCLFRDWTKGLAHIHGHGMMHRNIHPNSLGVILKSSPRGIIMDLGDLTDERRSYYWDVGALPYKAPEMWMMEYFDVDLFTEYSDRSEPYTSAVDIWSLGICMMVMLKGSPFVWWSLDNEDVRPRDIKAKLTENHVDRNRHGKFEPEVKKLVDLKGKGNMKIHRVLQNTIIDMTKWLPAERKTARDIVSWLNEAERKFKADWVKEAAIMPIAGTKRKQS